MKAQPHDQMEQRRLMEFWKRLYIGVCAIAAFVLGKWLARFMGHHESEFFIGGFMLGMAAMLLFGALWMHRIRANQHKRGMP